MCSSDLRQLYPSDGAFRFKVSREAWHGSLGFMLVEMGFPLNTPHEGLPLACAVENRDLNLVRYMLQRNADPNLADTQRQGNSPLHLAVLHMQPDMVSLLLQSNADPLMPNQGCETPLSLAQKSGYQEFVSMFDSL